MNFLLLFSLIPLIHGIVVKEGACPDIDAVQNFDLGKVICMFQKKLNLYIVVYFQVYWTMVHNAFHTTGSRNTFKMYYGNVYCKR